MRHFHDHYFLDAELREQTMAGEIKELLKEFLSIQNDLRKSSEATKPLRQRKKEITELLTDLVVENVDENDKGEFVIPARSGTLKVKRGVKRPTLKAALVANIIQTTLNCSAENAEAAAAAIFERDGEETYRFSFVAKKKRKKAQEEEGEESASA